MTEAQKILELIENVEPDDTDYAHKLDEIDILAYNWFIEIGVISSYYTQKTNSPVPGCMFSRSRDALKAIRGEVVLSNLIATLATEKLAELHAIIQVKEWKRDNEN